MALNYKIKMCKGGNISKQIQVTHIITILCGRWGTCLKWISGKDLFNFVAFLIKNIDRKKMQNKECTIFVDFVSVMSRKV